MDRMRAVPAAVLALLLGPLTVGCGADDEPARGESQTGSAVSVADRACRDRWHALSEKLGHKAGRGMLVQRAFESRWDSIDAGIGYYESTARAGQCGHLLTVQRTAIRDLDRVVNDALPFDLEQQAAAARADRERWRAEHPDRRAGIPIRLDYRTLRTRAATASRDLTPAITELAAVDPADAQAVDHALQDLDLLANASEAYTACIEALIRVNAFVHRPLKPKPSR